MAHHARPPLASGRLPTATSCSPAPLLRRVLGAIVQCMFSTDAAELLPERTSLRSPPLQTQENRCLHYGFGVCPYLYSTDSSTKIWSRAMVDNAKAALVHKTPCRRHHCHSKIHNRSASLIASIALQLPTPKKRTSRKAALAQTAEYGTASPLPA